MEKQVVIITLFSADKVQLDSESTSGVLSGEYPVRVKSKVLATIRNLVSSTGNECVIGFVPVTISGIMHGRKCMVDNTPDHYGELALYLAPETSCRIVSDLMTSNHGQIACRKAQILKVESA